MDVNNFYSDLGQSHWLYGTQGNALVQTLKKEIQEDFLTQSYLDGVLTSLTVTTPTSGSDAVNKTYVDSLSYLTAGTGLTKTGGTLSVNTSQTQVTTVGTLSSLTVAGNSTVNTAPTTSNHVVRKVDLDNAIQSVVSGGTPAVSAGAGLSLTGAQLDVLVSNIGIEIDSATNKIRLKDSGITPAKLAMGSTFDFTNTTDSSSPTSGALTVAGGLGVAKTIHANSHAITDGTWSYALKKYNHTINGVLLDAESSGATLCRLNLGSTGAGAGDYTSSIHIYNKGRNTESDQSKLVVESTPTNNAIYNATSGSGVAKNLVIYSGTTFNTSGQVSISTTTASTSTTTGALTVAGGVAIGGSLFVGGNVTVATPTNSGHASTKAYVDGLIKSAGTGLTETSGVFSVNASQPQITTVGTLTALTVSNPITCSDPTLSTHVATRNYVDSYLTAGSLDGNIGTLNVTNTTQSSLSGGTGALTVAGGIYISKDISSGGILRSIGGINTRGLITVSSTTTSFSNNATISFNSTSNVNGISYLQQMADSSESNHLMTSFYAGTGIFDSGSLSPVEIFRAVNSRCDFKVPVRVQETSNATSTSTGALRVTGGLSVAKDIWCTGQGTISTANASRLYLQTASVNRYALGAVDSDGAGDFHIWDALSARRVFGYYKGSNVIGIGSSAGSSTVVFDGTTDSTSTSDGAVQVYGGMSVRKRLNTKEMQVGSLGTATSAVHWQLVNASTSPSSNIKTVTVNFGKTMPDLSYCPLVTAEYVGGDDYYFCTSITGKSTTGFSVKIIKLSGSGTGWASDVWLSVAVFR